ncbi:hypothetical protein BC833DRAFT_607784 [Globomyces pollinis-pini]|nr:hypothetical protein BC833DRAFT_607784 [Globomyces pollinis-pini]
MRLTQIKEYLRWRAAMEDSNEQMFNSTRKPDLHKRKVPLAKLMIFKKMAALALQKCTILDGDWASDDLFLNNFGNLSHIKSIHFSAVDIRNVKLITPKLQSLSLTLPNVYNNGLEYEIANRMTQLSDLTSLCLYSSTSVNFFHYLFLNNIISQFGWHIPTVIVEAVLGYSNLVELSLNCLHFSPQSINCLPCIISNNIFLESLELDCQSPDHFRLIAPSITYHKHLMSLKLVTSWMCLQDIVQEFISLLKTNKSIKHLSLDDDDTSYVQHTIISRIIQPIIHEGLKYNTTITQITLEHCISAIDYAFIKRTISKISLTNPFIKINGFIGDIDSFSIQSPKCLINTLNYKSAQLLKTRLHMMYLSKILPNDITFIICSWLLVQYQHDRHALAKVLFNRNLIGSLVKISKNSFDTCELIRCCYQLVD